MAIKYENEYKKFIIKEGVGANDKVASSPDSYISYLRSVSKLINQDISPSLIQNEASINIIIEKLNKKRAQKTLKNYRSALKRYLSFAQTKVVRHG